MPRNTSVSYEQITRQVPAKETSLLLRVSGALASSLELSQVLQIAIESAIDLLGLDTGAIYILEDQKLYLGATTPPLPPQFPVELRYAKLEAHPHIQESLTRQAPVYLHDGRTATLTPAEKNVVESRHLISILYFPLLLKEEAIGTFIVGTTREPRLFSKTEIDLCYILSYQASLAITNARLYHQSQQATTEVTRAYDATLEGWARLLDMRDHSTEEHTHRVIDLTLALAKELGYPEPQLLHLRRGALLHDIGKMAIPDSILQKPEPLSEEEWAIMRLHPQMAYDLLSHIPYLKPALDIPYCHHEKKDGTGYPRQLKDEQIPLAARIFAIVDVYDALTSDRPYREAWEKEQALQFIQAQSGKHFFPEIVNAFLAMMSPEANSNLCNG